MCFNKYEVAKFNKPPFIHNRVSNVNKIKDVSQNVGGWLGRTCLFVEGSNNE